MDELDDYGSFNSRYEGVGTLAYLPGDSIPVYFEARQLADGRLLVACVSTGEPIRKSPHAIDGHLLSGEPFSTMWGRGITEICRSEGRVNKAHYVANMVRVRYTTAVQPDDRSVQLALHNFIPGPHIDVSDNELSIIIRGCELTISPVGNYSQQADQLLRYGGNFRTAWVRAPLADAQGHRHTRVAEIEEIVTDMLTPISLALGTLVSCPQIITFDAEGNRNDVVHYTSSALEFSDYVSAQRWDSPIQDTVAAWFSRPQLLDTEAIRVYIHQHLDACSTKVFLETRALVAATLLDVLAGSYAKRWAPTKKTFKEKLARLLDHLGVDIGPSRLTAIVKGRNSLVHSGGFVTAEHGQGYSDYQNLMRLGRSILLLLVGVPCTLHEALET